MFSKVGANRGCWSESETCMCRSTPAGEREDREAG